MKSFGNLTHKVLLPVAALVMLAACSVNPATGEQQFTAFMSPAQEQQVGAQEHNKIIRTFGVYEDQSFNAYVNQIGQKVAQNTERGDVNYTFTVLDTQMVNAFALPGGYIYVSRGLMAQANSEAELAAVIAHEIAHVTARHSAERYSQGVLTTLGAGLISAATDSSLASQAAGIGSNLYIKSYSRSQEHQADELGVRYLHRAGYSTEAMAQFLANLQQHSAFEARLSGRGQPGGVFNYFSTHPETGDRVQQSVSHTRDFPPNAGVVNRDGYLQRLDGVTYGYSAKHGFVRGNDFWHPDMGFTFSVPDDFTISNQPTQVLATSRSGAAIIFDAGGAPSAVDPYNYLTQVWMQGEPLQNAERITINGMQAASAAFTGNVNGRPMTVRLVAIQWAPDRFFRFQMAIPQGAGQALVEDLKRTTYSFRRMTASEKQSIRPYRLDIVTAGAGDTVASLARRMAFDDLKEERFRVLNNLSAGEQVRAGQLYKVVVE